MLNFLVDLPAEEGSSGNAKLEEVGMGLRRITLEDNWYRGDSGVMLVFCNVDDKTKELGICLPQTENRYRLITNSNPDGVEVTEKNYGGSR